MSEQDSTPTTHSPAPCRNCGEYTTTRAEGIPYCSGSCVYERRAELKQRENMIELDP